jgi:glutamate synthase (NADPH/NADH) small chain
MGKPTGFLDYERLTSRYRPVEDRIQDYRDVSVQIPEEEMVRESARCMDCGTPFCHSLGCPLYNLIPEWNDAVYKGQWHEAYSRLELTNNFPEITGRICPAACEAACTLSINSNPVSIKQIELAVIEKAFSKGWVEPKKPPFETGKKVAIVGSGPAGLAAAQMLRRMGHSVSLFEKSAKIGGLLRYGIPDFKLEKHILDRRLAQLEAEEIEFETDVIIGEDLSSRYLKRKYDIILLTLGAGKPRDIHVPGREYEGIYFALDYLTQSNRFANGEISNNEMISAGGRKVLVIGGGDTGSDCVGTVIRQGAKKITQVEILPMPEEWKKLSNPQWPYWPNILRTSSSQEEGCERHWSISTRQFTGGNNARVLNTRFVKVEWKNTEGSRPEMMEIPGSEFSLDVDLVLLSMGFVHVEHSRLLEDLGVKLDERGNIASDSKYMTSVDGVFTAGDANTGASLVVMAILHGRRAALAINDYLK